MRRKPYVSIDIETTGLDPEFCQILEVGAIIDDWVTPIEELQRFQCYVQHERIVGTPFALSMHSKIFRHLADIEPGYNYERPVNVAITFHTWLRQHKIFPYKNHITAAGKNFASFDRQFLEKLPYWKIHIPTQHRTIDPGNLYWNPDIDYGLPSLKTCMERAGISGEVAHTAVEDALVVVKLIRNHFKIQGEFP